VGYVLCANVVRDSETETVLFQAAGTPGMRRQGPRGGPQGRSLLERAWDGGYERFAWRGPSTMRLHPRDAEFSVIRRWDPVTGRCRGWYVNLERRWSRTPIGFDSRDDVLDVVAEPDLSACRLKDEDELAWSVQTGEFTAAQAAAIRRTAADVCERIQAGAWPFQEAAWDRLRPEPGWPDPALPPGWDVIGG
jgi:Protein of unknown function (DUF402)